MRLSLLVKENQIILVFLKINIRVRKDTCTYLLNIESKYYSVRF